MKLDTSVVRRAVTNMDPKSGRARDTLALCDALAAALGEQDTENVREQPIEPNRTFAQDPPPERHRTTLNLPPTGNPFIGSRF